MSPETENKLASAKVAIICVYVLPIHKITQQFDYRLPVALPMLHAKYQIEQLTQPLNFSHTINNNYIAQH